MHKMVIYQFENLILQNIHFIWHRHFWTITGNAKSFGWTHKRIWPEERNYQVFTVKGWCSEVVLKNKGWLFGLGLGTKLTTWSYFQIVDVLAPSSHRWASPPSTAPEKASAFSRNNSKTQCCRWKIFAQLTIAWPNTREKVFYLFKSFCQGSVINGDISNKNVLYRNDMFFPTCLSSFAKDSPGVFGSMSKISFNCLFKLSWWKILWR